MTNKEFAIKAVQQIVYGAQDNLLRAEAAFRGSDMTAVYGASKQTRQEIVDGYQSQVETARQCVAWLEGVTP